jgi:hypothetical protein
LDGFVVVELAFFLEGWPLKSKAAVVATPAPS